jgi:uncharacterized protein (DUF2235 family)
MKRLVVCCDGTWNDADTQTIETNVSILARSVHASQNTDVQQIVLYLRGVGTSGLQLETWIEGATGLGINDNILSAYMFLAQNFVPGDEIFIFGFSRGAFTARSLAGFVTACGLLKRQRLGDIPAAWTYYRSSPPHSPAKFKELSGTDSYPDPQIKFLGVWDTVGAMGVPGGLLKNFEAKKFAFHDTGPSKAVRHGCHALAIDEHRNDFVPTLWTGQVEPGNAIEQVWFCGCHSDVGGGYKTRRLADIPLVWMAEKAEAEGLNLDWGCLPDKSTLDPLQPTHDSSQGLFELDHYFPIYRQIAGRQFDVHLPGKVYTPPGSVINEKVHTSVWERYNKVALACTDDDNGTCSSVAYAAKNLVPFFDQNGAPLAGAPFEE